MAFDTYAALQASVADFLNRGDLTASIPGYIALAEAQMMRSFVQRARSGTPVPRRLIKRSNAVLSAGNEYVSVPQDFVGPRTMFIALPDRVREVKYLGPDEFQVIKTTEHHHGHARVYTVVGGEFQFYPVPTRDHTIELAYIARVPALSDTNQSNWILADHPDAYLYGALLQSAPYLKEDARVSTWATLFQAAVDGICASDPMPVSRATLKNDLPLACRDDRIYSIELDY